MPGRTPAEAVEQHRTLLQQALACVCHGVLLSKGGYDPRGGPHLLVLGPSDSVRLSGNPPLWLTALQRYRIVESPAASGGPWAVLVTTYYYALLETDEREILAYHWHPSTAGAVSHPHLHLEAGAQVQREALTKAHLPTGPVALQDVLRLAIRELHVTPLRSDWEDVLNRTRESSFTQET